MDVSSEILSVEAMVSSARAAQAGYESGATQKRYDEAAHAAAWAIMEPARNRQLAELAVASTGLGNIGDKIIKNHRKTLGLMRDIQGVQTCGILSDDMGAGLVEIARPIGVVGAIVPSTNPAATPANNIINALKCGNAIILSPSPKGVATCEMLLGFIHAEFDKIGENPDLVQMLPPPGTKVKTQRLLELADLAIVTGSQDNVRRAYESGTPAIGVGAGNVAVIIDETADLVEAAAKIAASKTFDNSTSCSSENALIVVDEVYEQFLTALTHEGGAVVGAKEASGLVKRLWPDGKLSRQVMAKDATATIEALGLKGMVPNGTRFVAVETSGIGPNHPLSGEKLSRVMALYRAADFEQAVETARRILLHQGAGHSVGLHSQDSERPIWMGQRLPVCRVIVNQPHSFATGGSFENGLPFSLSMGCGSWGGNSIDTNLHWRHFLQHTRVVRPISPREPAVEEIFSDYWAKAGQ